MEGLVEFAPLDDLDRFDGSSSHSWAGVKVVMSVSMAKCPARDPKRLGEVVPVSLPAQAPLWWIIVLNLFVGQDSRVIGRMFFGLDRVLLHGLGIAT